jgi:hypothetical protein
MLELDKLLRDLDHTLDKVLVFLLTVFPFILRTKQPQITLAALASAGVTSQLRILALTISLKSAVEGNIIFSYRFFAWTAQAIYHLLNNLMLSFTVWTNPKLAHLLWVAYMQPARVHFKKQVRQTKCTAMDNKNCIHFAVICDPVDLDKILETYDVGDGFFIEPNPKLVARYLGLLCDLQTTTVACHVVATQIES